MNSAATERLRLGRLSLGGVREAPGGGGRACVRGGTDAPWPLVTKEEGGMLAPARRPAETQGSWRPALETVKRFRGVVETELRRLPRVPAGGAGPPPIDTGRLLHEAGLRLGRLYGRGAWFLLRREAAAARRLIAGRLLVILAVGSLTFTLASVVATALLLDGRTLHALVPVAEVAAVGAALT